MQFPISALICLPPPQHIDLCITMPGGATICAMDLLNSADPFQVLQSMFISLNSALTPLTPFFDVVDCVEALVKCIQAIPDCLGPPPNPDPLIKCIPNVVKALAKLLSLLPPLSIPIMILQTIKAIIEALNALVSRLIYLVRRNVRLIAASLKAAEPGNVSLKVVVDCATGNYNTELLNLNACLQPLNRLIGIVNLFGQLVPGLPNPVIPDISDLGPDAEKAIQPLKDAIQILQQIADAIPIP